MRQFLILCFCLVLPAVVFSQDKTVQQEAAWRNKTVRQWAEQLADQDVRSRWYATYALGQIGPGATEAVGALMRILENRHGHEYVRGSAAWALGRILERRKAEGGRRNGEEGRGKSPISPPPSAFVTEAVAVLIEALESKHMSVRRNAPEALGNIAQAATAAVPGLVQVLDDEDPTVGASAAMALWKIDRHRKAIPALLRMLRQDGGHAAYEAAVALGRLYEPPCPQGGPEADSVVPALVASFRRADADVHRAAARSLGQIGPPAVPALREALADPDPEVRRSAVEALGRIGGAAVPVLIEALKNEAPSARRAAARALERLDPVAKAAEAALIEATSDRDPQVRQAAARALGKIRKE